MGDTHDKVISMGELSKLKELVSMIVEYEFLLDRENDFKDAKYLIVVNVEKS